MSWMGCLETVAITDLGARLRSLRRNGLAATSVKAARRGRIAVDRTLLSLLKRRFGFARWHAESPLSSRPYRRDLAAMINSLAPACVVEVGCGLGAMLGLVQAPRRIGYDIDPGVIRAARFLRDKSIVFKVGGFEDVEDLAIDVLVAVNWTHDHPPDQLHAWLDGLIGRTRYLLLDAIDLGEPGYANHHDFAFLSAQATLIRSDRFGESNRHFLLFETNA